MSTPGGQVNRFGRSVITLAGGTVLGQVVAIGVSPVLSRLYSPEDFGVLAVFAAVVSVLAVVASGRYEMAIPLPVQKRAASHVVVLAFVTLAATTAGIALLVALVGGQFVRLVNAPALGSFLWIVPVAHAAVGSYQILVVWATRVSEYDAIARTKLLQQVWGQVLVSVPLGFLKLGPVGLILGYTLSLTAGAGSLARRLLKRRSVAGPVSRHGLKHVAWKYKKFPTLTVWAGLTNAAGIHIPVILLSLFFLEKTVGHYSLALRVLGLPAAVIGQAIAQVFYARAAATRDESDLHLLTKRLAVTLLSISVPVFGVIAIAGPSLFEAAFGADWRTAGVFAQILSPWFMLVLVSSPLSSLSLVKQRQGYSLIIALLETAARIGLTVVAARLTGSPTWTLAAISFAGVIVCTSSLWWILSLVGCSFGDVVRATVRNTRGGVLVLLGVSLAIQSLSVWGAVLLSLGGLAIALGLTAPGVRRFGLAIP